MGAKRRMRTRSNSVEVLNRHSRVADPITWPELQAERELEAQKRRLARERREREAKAV